MGQKIHCAAHSVKKRFVYVCFRRAESKSVASNQGQRAALVIHKNGAGAAKRNSSETTIKQEMLRIEPRLAFINGVLLENRVLIFRFQLLAVYVLQVHNCGECHIDRMFSLTIALFQNKSY
jgi:hypothetical protein